MRGFRTESGGVKPFQLPHLPFPCSGPGFHVPPSEKTVTEILPQLYTQLISIRDYTCLEGKRQVEAKKEDGEQPENSMAGRLSVWINELSVF
jgi:hypothetical protein